MRARPGPEVAIKGTALVPFRHFVQERFGDDGLERLVAGLPVESREHFRELALPVSWYPFSLALDCIDAIATLFGDDSVRACAFHNLDYGTRHILRLLFRVGSPEFMLARSDRVWRSYYSTGAMTVPLVEQGRARIEVHDFPWLTDPYRLLLQSSLEAVVVKAGGSVQRAQRSGGEAADAVFELMWE